MSKTVLERAYELARSGQFDKITPLKKALRAEGYAVWSIEGAGLIRSLQQEIKKARGVPVAPRKAPRRLLTPDERSAAARRGAATRLGHGETNA